MSVEQPQSPNSRPKPANKKPMSGLIEKEDIGASFLF